MPEELEVFKKLAEAEVTPDFSVPFTGNYEADQQIVEHKAWLKPSGTNSRVPGVTIVSASIFATSIRRNTTTILNTTSGSIRIRWRFVPIGSW